MQDVSSFGVSVRLESLPEDEKKESGGLFGGLLGGKKKEEKGGAAEDAEVRSFLMYCLYVKVLLNLKI